MVDETTWSIMKKNETISFYKISLFMEIIDHYYYTVEVELNIRKIKIWFYYFIQDKAQGLSLTSHL